MLGDLFDIPLANLHVVTKELNKDTLQIQRRLIRSYVILGVSYTKPTRVKIWSWQGQS